MSTEVAAKALRVTAAALLPIMLLGPALPAEGTERDGAWLRAESPRRWSFPVDHGAHPRFRTEWWYLTGRLHDGGGKRYGYQLTFFRRGMRLEDGGDNPWWVRDLYAAHFTVTDIDGGRFFTAERLSRSGPGLAGAGTDRLDVRTLDWFLRADGETVIAEAREGALALRLDLDFSDPPVLHGEGGLSRKGPAPGQASFYYSLPRIESRATLRTSRTGAEAVLTGWSWFDHEFGSNQLSGEQEGWDWFGLRLDDGRSVMIYLLRRKDGTVEPSSSGTLVEADGSARHLALEDIRLEVAARWKSPRSGAEYPSRWRIEIPLAGIDLEVYAVAAAQELDTSSSTGITYWEGAVDGTGISSGKSVSAEGYAELTGYAGGIGGRF